MTREFVFLFFSFLFSFPSPPRVLCNKKKRLKKGKMKHDPCSILTTTAEAVDTDNKRKAN